MARNPFIKVALFERVATRLQDCKVVGQGDDYLLLERPQPKPRAGTPAPRKKRTAGAKPRELGTTTVATGSTGI